MKKLIFMLFMFCFIASCGSGAFTLKKKSAADEFLVEKKSPLVLPPDYGKLPLPSNKQIQEVANEKNELKKILDKNKVSASETKKNPKTTSIEKSILDKIK